jgi:hypothetical protein
MAAKPKSRRKTRKKTSKTRKKAKKVKSRKKAKKTRKPSKTRRTAKKRKKTRKTRKKTSRRTRGRKPVKRPKKPVKVAKGLKRLASGLVIPKRLPVRPRKMICVYGKSVNPKLITQASIEAYNKRRYTTHDFRASDFISDPRLHNLMVKIAILDRIEEEIVRIYPDVTVDRINSVTLVVR